MMKLRSVIRRGGGGATLRAKKDLGGEQPLVDHANYWKGERSRVEEWMAELVSRIESALHN